MPKEAKRDRPIPPWKPEHRGRRLTNDFEAGIVRLEPRTTKNDEGRTFPFDALPALKRLLETQRDRTKALERATGRIIPSVFHHDGQPIRHLRRAWLSACKRAATVTHENGVTEVLRPELLD